MPVIVDWLSFDVDFVSAQPDFRMLGTVRKDLGEGEWTPIIISHVHGFCMDLQVVEELFSLSSKIGVVKYPE